MRRAAGFVLALVALAALWLGVSSRPDSAPGLSVRGQPEPTKPARREELPLGLTPERVRLLASWLLVPPLTNAGPSRDIFRPEQALPASHLLSESPGPLPLRPLSAPASEEISLAGFVLRQDSEGKARALAVLRAQGEIWLVGEGELAGPYLVQKIVPGEEVELVEVTTGLGRVLKIE